MSTIKLKTVYNRKENTSGNDSLILPKYPLFILNISIKPQGANIKINLNKLKVSLSKHIHCYIKTILIKIIFFY